MTKCLTLRRDNIKIVLTSMEDIRFTKMHGIGNDYIYINCLRGCPADLPALSVEMSRPHYGIGADGIITIESSDVADFKMRIFNADGSEAKMCGNGSRCVGKYVFDNGITTKSIVTLETLSGIKTMQLHVKDDSVESVTVDMGEPIIDTELIPVKAEGCHLINELIATSAGPLSISAVSMGNPHGVIFVDDVSSIDLKKLGRELEIHPIWPDRANIEFAQAVSPNEIIMRVWERGSGETMACGTGACATAVIGVLTGRTSRNVLLNLKGGELRIRWDSDDGHVYMTGQATKVFDGIYTRY